MKWEGREPVRLILKKDGEVVEMIRLAPGDDVPEAWEDEVALARPGTAAITKNLGIAPKSAGRPR